MVDFINFIKGIASFKDLDFFRGFGVKNRSGYITAYLPQEKIFAINFMHENQWITFQDWTEEQFKDKFNIILDESLENPFNKHIDNLIKDNNYKGYNAFWNEDSSDGFLLVEDTLGNQQKFNFVGEKI